MNDIKQFMTNNTMLAPMAGYTDNGYRSICVEYGCGMTVTEMVSAKALVMGNIHTEDLLVRQSNDNRCALQIFGHEPDVMAESINLPVTSHFEVIDINMGCPVRKIVGNGDGSALLENVPLASKIISTVKKACGNRLLTVKFRTGVEDADNVVDFARMCCDSGADMITVHLRTRKQMYMGSADYTLLPDICSAVSIPVIANGDIATRQDYLFATQQCGSYGVAIGRGALGRPYIFAEILGNSYSYNMMHTIERHMQMVSSNKPDRVIASEMKKHIAYYLRGIPYSKEILIAVNMAKTPQGILDALQHLGEHQ